LSTHIYLRSDLFVDKEKASSLIGGLAPMRCPGVDDLTWTTYATDLERNLTDLHARVHSGAYRALPALRDLWFEGVDPAATGWPAYHPSPMLKLYIYGYLNRVQSSRRLEREAGRNLEVMWLTGRLVPEPTSAYWRVLSNRAHALAWPAPLGAGFPLGQKGFESLLIDEPSSRQKTSRKPTVPC
jgi:Transposase domain (DUF772)